MIGIAFVLCLLVLDCAVANIGFRNGPLFTVFEIRLQEKLAAHRAAKGAPALACDERLMEFAADLAAADAPARAQWPQRLAGLAGAAAYAHDVAALLVGSAYASADAVWTALAASDAHAAAIASAEYADFGIGHEPNLGVWVIVLAKARAGQSRAACAPLAGKLFVPVTADMQQTLRQVSIGAPDDIIATAASGALVQKYHACFRTTGSSLVCANSNCCPAFSLGMAPQRGASWVSTSLDGTCYAASSAQVGAPELHKRLPLVDGSSAMAWERAAGSFVKVSVGGVGTVFGISVAKNLYKLVGAKWALLPGQFAHVAVGADGTVWAIDFDNARVLRRSKGAWQWIKGRLEHIAVGDAGSVWGVGTDGRLYAYAGDQVGWRRFAGNETEIDSMLGQQARYVAVGANSYEVWLIDTSGTPHRLARPDLASQLLAGAIGEPMAAFADDNQHLAAADGLTSSLPDDDMSAHTLAPTPTPLAEPITPIGGQTTPVLSAVSVDKPTPAPTTGAAPQQAATSAASRLSCFLFL